MRLAHRFAIENEAVRADAVEVTEFPHLANRYRVMGVPLTVVNEVPAIEGAMPEARFVEELIAAVARKGA